MKKQFSQMTKYHRLFSRTYWGTCYAVPENMKHMDGIFDNRNLMVETFGVLRRMRKPQMEDKDLMLFDHVELYAADGGYLLLTSPYFLCHPSDITGFDEINKTYKVIKIPPVYRETASSFVILIPSGKASLNSFMKKHGQFRYFYK